MKSSELLLQLKDDIKQFKPKINVNMKNNDEKKDSVNNVISKYNRDNFNEIINSTIEGLNNEINEETLDDFKFRIDNYFRLYSPNQDEFKEFIKIISLYLTFIVKKPLHPPGIKFSNGLGVYKKEDLYYCSAKNVFIKDKLSLCKYCVSKGSES